MGGGRRRVPRLTLALLLAGGVIAGAVGTASAYWLGHHERVEQLEVRDFHVELAPSAPGPYQLYLPVPADKAGQPAAGLALRVLEGHPRFALVQTEHGVALSVRGEGPLKLAASGPLPIRLSLDDLTFSFRQFKFWSYLAPESAGPVLVKLEVRVREHAADWERHLDTSKAILVQETLEPEGWQVVRATQLFDISLATGWGAGFPRMALGATMASAASLYAPLGVALLGARPRAARPGGGAAHDGFK